MPIATARGIDARFDRRRCGCEHDACVFKSCAHDRHVARVVGNAVLLLVGGLMFLIDDDEAKIAEGQEQRRARAGDNLHFARRRTTPDARPLSRRHARMPFGGFRAKARGEALEKLRGERDFWHEHERLSAVLQSARDRFEIDFRFAGAGDAFEQEWAKGVLRNGARQFIRGGLLFGFELRRIEQGVERRRDRLRRRGDSRERSLVDQGVNDAGGYACGLRESFFGEGQPAFSGRDDARSRRRHALRRGAGEPIERSSRFRSRVFGGAGR